MKLHHIGYLVQNLENAIKIFKVLEYKIKNKYYDKERNINFVFMENQKVVIELVSPNDSKMFEKLYKIYKIGPYHLCYSSNDFNGDRLKLRKLNFFPVSEVQCASIQAENRMCFLYNPDIGLIELYEQI